jgi:hypothetical protein
MGEQILIRVWNGTMARGQRRDVKVVALPDRRLEVRWYGSGYDVDPWKPQWMRTNSAARALEELRGLVEAEPQYQWRDMPIDQETGPQA